MTEPVKARLARAADGIDKVRDDVTLLPGPEAFQLLDDCLRATALLLRQESAAVPDVAGRDLDRFHERPA